MTTVAIPPVAVMAIIEMADDRILERVYGVGPLMGFLFAVATVCVVLAFYPLERLSLSTQHSLRPLGSAAAVSMAWLPSGFLSGSFAGLESDWMYAVVAASALTYLLWRSTETTGAVLLAVRLWCVRRTWFGGRALS